MLLTNNKPADFTNHVDHEIYEIITADDFFILVVDSNPASLSAVIAQQLAYWGRDEKALDQALAGANCPEFAKSVEYEREQRFRASENTPGTRRSR